MAAAPPLLEPAGLPFEKHMTVGGSGEANALQLLEVRERRQIGPGHRHVESLRRRPRHAKRLDRILEPGIATVELRACVPYVERFLRPAERPIERGEPIIVHAAHRARECSTQVVAAGEEPERAHEVRVAGQRPFLVGEEDLPHAGKVDV